MRFRPAYLILLAIVALGFAAVIVAAATGGSRNSLTTGDGTERIRLATTVDLFGVGVADIDGDGRLDVFTDNHSAVPSFLLNGPDGRFEDRRLALGLGGSVGFRDAEVSDVAPVIDRPGLFLFWQGGVLRLVANGIGRAPRRIDLALNGGIVARAGGDVAVVAQEEIEGEEFPTRMTVEVSGDGTLELASLRWTVNGRIALDEAFDLDQVFVGRDHSTPGAHAFDLVAGQDRHGIAWTDLDGDLDNDALVLIGGEAGLMTEPAPYPVYLREGEGFAGPAALPGLVQELCPTRQVQLGDADGDGSEDIAIVCGRGHPPRDNQPNELFTREDGAFRNRAAALGLALPGQGLFRWLDLDGDGAQEAVWATLEGIEVLARRDGRFATVQKIAHPGRKAQLAPGDLDGDGDIDLFVAQPGGDSLVLVNEDGTLTPRQPDAFGLPATATCANFVDRDNDGDDDFHALPGGLFRAAERGTGEARFEATGLLSGPDRRASCQWFDANGDGRRDLLVTLPADEPLLDRAIGRIEREIEAIRFRGRYEGRIYDPDRDDLSLYLTPPGQASGEASGQAGQAHWLAVDLRGPAENPTGAGARLALRVGDRTLVRHAGHAEGSTSSNGHFRAYFGLGAVTPAGSLTITWPDGLVQEIAEPGIDRLLTVEHPRRPESG